MQKLKKRQIDERAKQVRKSTDPKLRAIGSDHWLHSLQTSLAEPFYPKVRGRMQDGVYAQCPLTTTCADLPGTGGKIIFRLERATGFPMVMYAVP